MPGSRSKPSRIPLATVNLLLAVLPALRILIVECGQLDSPTSDERLHQDDTKREELGRVSAALFIIEQHVRNIHRLKQLGSFESSLLSLADFVGSFTADQTPAGRGTEKVGHGIPRNLQWYSDFQRETNLSKQTTHV